MEEKRKLIQTKVYVREDLFPKIHKHLDEESLTLSRFINKLIEEYQLSIPTRLGETENGNNK